MDKDVMTKLGDAYAEVQEANAKQRALAKAAKDAKSKDKVSLKKAPWDKKEEVEEDASNDKSDDGEGLDKADPKAAKKKFKDRKDKDIDNLMKDMEKDKTLMKLMELTEAIDHPAYINVILQDFAKHMKRIKPHAKKAGTKLTVQGKDVRVDGLATAIKKMFDFMTSDGKGFYE